MSGAWLKLLAAVLMVADHVGYDLFPGAVVLRAIGRPAFPIYAFLIAEGVFHTHDGKKYLLRLGIFALVSEIPYNLVLRRALFATDTQNVGWTLLLGALALLAVRALRERGQSVALCAVVCALCVLAAELGQTDYGGAGVLMILLYGLLREKNLRISVLLGTVAGVALLVLRSGWMVELWGFAAILPLCAYSGERGRAMRWYYAFYPAHLLVIAAVERLSF